MGLCDFLRMGFAATVPAAFDSKLAVQTSLANSVFPPGVPIPIRSTSQENLKATNTPNLCNLNSNVSVEAVAKRSPSAPESH
jgi:hypothetical protein